MDPKNSLTIGTQPIKIRSDSQLVKRSDKRDFPKKPHTRISRSEGSYTDEEGGIVLRSGFELGSEPLLNISKDASAGSGDVPKQDDVLEEHTPSSTASSLPYVLSTGSSESQNTPLMARTNALLTTKSFNLVRPKL